MKRFNRYRGSSWTRCWSVEWIYSNHWGWQDLLSSVGCGPRRHGNIFSSYHRSLNWSTDI